MPHEWWLGGPWWVFPIVMPVVMVVVLLIGLFVVREVFGVGPRWLRRRGPAEEEDEALRILRRRYAAGEITEDEYLDRRAMLEVRERDRVR